jgi:aryl carrier-like protein
VVGRNDNFFELGGDSILAIQVVARAQEAGIALSPLDLFEHPTVALVAQAASDLARSAESARAAAQPELEPEPVPAAVPAPAMTASDFPLARVDRSQLDILFGRIAGDKEA